jgi:xylulose-5-phosphate/fructose-6-phosphate phosphoketolase
LATAWQSNKFLDPITDGAVLPILHLNGYKISNPTVLARIEHEELEQFFRGCGWTPYFVEGDEPEKMHELMAATLEKAIEEIRRIKENARNKNDTMRPRWPMIVLRSPKGWTDRRKWMACKSRALSGRTRCRSWWMPSIQIMSNSLKAG